MRILYGLLGILTLLPAVSPLPARAEAPSSVVFSEINWAGSGASTADEWLELANLSAAPIELTGWSIMGAAGAGKSLSLPANTVIPAYGSVLLSNYDLTDPKTTLVIKPDVVTTAISLSNSGLDLSLISPDGTVVDHFTNGSTPVYGSTSPYASAERNLDTLGWKTANSTINISAGTQLGTPGEIIISIPESEPISVPVVDEPAPIPESEDPLTDDTASEEPIAPPQTPAPVTTDPCLMCPVQTVTVTVPTPTPTAVPEEPIVEHEPAAPAPVAIAYPAHSVLINEFVSDPADGIEWIEIVNSTDAAIDLTGWTEKDGTTSTTSFPAQTLAPHAFFVLENPKGKLNNDGDSIFIMDATGTTIDAISYDKTAAPDKGKSLARHDDGSWAETNPTPQQTNQWNDTYETTIDTSAAINPDTATQSETTAADPDAGAPSPIRVELPATVEAPISNEMSESPAPTTVSTPDIFDAASLTDVTDGEKVTVDGVVVGLPGVFGKQLMYLNGLEVYFNKADWPKLKYMTHVQVKGVVQQKDGYTRIKIAARTDVKIIGQDALAPETLSELSDASHGGYFSAEGSVTDLSKTGLKLELENGDILAIAAAPHVAINFSKLTFGDRIAVTGVTRIKNDVWTLAITDVKGLTVLNDDSATALSPDEVKNDPKTSNTKLNTLTPPPGKPIPWVGGGLLTTSLGALGYWLARAKGITLPFIT